MAGEASKREWPMEITDAVLAKNAHISEAKIRQDIADTEAEIVSYKALLVAHESIALHAIDPGERRMAAFRSGAYPGMISERQAFVDFATRILAARELVMLPPTGAQG